MQSHETKSVWGIIESKVSQKIAYNFRRGLKPDSSEWETLNKQTFFMQDQ